MDFGDSIQIVELLLIQPAYKFCCVFKVSGFLYIESESTCNNSQVGRSVHRALPDVGSEKSETMYMKHECPENCIKI